MTDTMQRRDFLKGVPSSVMAASVVGCSAASGTTAQKSRPSRRSDLERGGVTVFPPPPTNAAVITVGSNQYTYDPTGGNTNGQTVTTLASYTDPGGRFVMTNTLVQRSDIPLRLYFRAIPGWSCVIFEYGDVTDQTNNNFSAYTATVGGQNISLVGHWKFSRWRWQSGPWPFPLVSIANLTAAKLIPRYDPTLGSSAPGRVTYSPMGIDSMAADMQGTGGRDDIGWINGWASAYICNPTTQNLTNVLGIGECAGTWPMHPRDPATGALLDRTKHFPYNVVAGSVAAQGNFIFTGPPGTAIPPTPTSRIHATGDFWFYGNPVIPASGTLVWPGRTAGANNNFPAGPATLDPAIPGVSVTYDLASWRLGSGLAMDAAHWPMMSYVPWLLTGDPYYLENLQAEAMTMLGNGLTTGGYPYGWGQTRAMAWCLRNFCQAARGTPATVPSWLLPKSSLEAILTNQLPKYQAVMASGPPRSTFNAWASSFGDRDLGPNAYHNGCYYSPWMEDYMCGSLALCVMLGYANWLPVLQWSAQNLLHRVNVDGTSGWDQRMMETYEFAFRDTTTSPIYPDWPTASAANAAIYLRYIGATSIPPLASITNPDYHNGCQAALALTWQAGVPAAQASAQFIASLRFAKGYKYCVAVS